MTVSTEVSRNDRVGNGVLDTFIFEFEIYAKTDIKVWVDGVPKYVDTHFTVPVAGINNPAGGTIVFTAGNIPINLAKIAIILDLPLTQLTDYVEGDKFPAETHETALDRLVKLAQALSNRLNLVLKLPVYSTLGDLMVPEGAGKLVGWNAGGTNFALYTEDMDTLGVITTKGDLVIGGNAGIPERKAIGTDGQIATVADGTVAWAAPAIVKLDDAGAPDDNTDLDASVAKHGLMSKADKTRLDGVVKQKIIFPASCFEIRVGAGWAQFVQTQGTNFDYGELDFDKDVNEKANTPPFRLSDYGGGNITIRIAWKANAIVNDVFWMVSFVGIADGEPFDAAMTDHNFAIDTVSDVAEDINIVSLIIDPAELSNNDTVIMKITRHADDGTDTLAVDAKLIYVELEFTEA